MNEELRKTLVNIWVSEGKPGQVQYGGSTFRAIGSSEDNLKFIPVDTNALYGSTSITNGGK